MNIVEELNKKFKCQKCSCSYSAESEAYIHNNCTHHTCSKCLNPRSESTLTNHQCPVCKCSTKITKNPLTDDVSTLMNEYVSLRVLSDKTRLENSVLKRERDIWKRDHHECAECETSDSEQNLQLCQTCHPLKYEDLEDVKKNALCSTCAIKKHMRKGHQTVDFYPYLRAYNFSSQFPKIDAKSEDFAIARDLLKYTVLDFNAQSINVSESYNVLTDMARRSKCTKHQVEFFEKVEKFMDESKSIHGEADSDIKKHTIKLKGNLSKLKEWYESRMENCVDESDVVKLENTVDL